MHFDAERTKPRRRDRDVPVHDGTVSREAEGEVTMKPIEPVVFRRHTASPRIVRARPGYADSGGEGLKPRLFKA